MAFVQTAQTARIDLFATLRASIEEFQSSQRAASKIQNHRSGIGPHE